MTTDFDTRRAVFYPSGDLAAGWYTGRVKQVLGESERFSPSGINDAIEIHQCKLIVDAHPYFFEDEELDRLKSRAEHLLHQACRVIGEAIARDGIEVVYESVEDQYHRRFWDLAAHAGSWRGATADGLLALLRRHSDCLRYVMGIAPMIKEFDDVVCGFLLESTELSAELIIGEFAMEGASGAGVHLPKSASRELIDRLMHDYLSSPGANLNYVRVLANWPNAARDRYNPSPEVQVSAKRRAEELNRSIFGQGAGFGYSVGVEFSPGRKACKGIVIDGDDYTMVFGTEWLFGNLDYETILNNFIYVFDFVNLDCMMPMPAHAHDPVSLVDRLTPRAIDVYPSSYRFKLNQAQALMAIAGYETCLGAAGARVEDALEYAYNEYMERELGVSGFSISLPAEGTSYLDRCKSIGPEIERVLKAFEVYAERGEVDEDFFPFMEVKRFDIYPSLVNGKYAVPGPDFEGRATLLFSDQSVLSFPCSPEDRHMTFFERMETGAYARETFDERYRGLIDRLVDDGLAWLRSDGIIEPTDKSRILKKMWDEGAIALYRKSEACKRLVEEMTGEGLASYCSRLFTPDEADYCNYMFNNAKFSDPLALRNKYDHARSSVQDPNADEYRYDYFRLLMLLVCITLKIVDDLSFALGKGGVEDFVDWPWVDEALVAEANRLMRE